MTLQTTESCETNKDIILEDNKIRKIIHNSDVYVLKLICDFINLMCQIFTWRDNNAAHSKETLLMRLFQKRLRSSRRKKGQQLTFQVGRVDEG